MGTDSSALIMRNNNILLILFSALLIPWLTLAGPNWLTLSKVSPNWGILWLLPFSLKYGRTSGILGGFFIGILLDSFSLGDVTHIPAFMLLGFWWGGFDKAILFIRKSFNTFTLAFLGSLLFGVSFAVQFQLIDLQNADILLKSWILQTLLSQAILTSLLAPIISSWLLFFWRR